MGPLMTTPSCLGDCAGNFSGDFLDLTSVDPQRVAWANDRAHISAGNPEAMSSSIFSRLFHTIDRGCDGLVASFFETRGDEET